MMGALAEFVCHLVCCNALGAVSGTAKGDEKLRGGCEEVRRSGNDIRSGNGPGLYEASLQVFTYRRVGDISRGTGAGKNDLGIFTD